MLTFPYFRVIAASILTKKYYRRDEKITRNYIKNCNYSIVVCGFFIAPIIFFRNGGASLMRKSCKRFDQIITCNNPFVIINTVCCTQVLMLKL